MKSKNNWYVITGTISSGKTTLVRLLEKRGFRVVYEVARVYIDQEMAKGRTIEEIRKDELLFQKKVTELKIKLEKELPREETIFFDRGIPDSDAYYKICGVSNDKFLEQAIANCSYKKIFLLDFFDLKKDYARVETKEQQVRIHNLLKESYEKIGAPLVEVPKTEEKEGRVDFVLNNL